MLRMDENIWIGNSADEQYADLDVYGVNAILNVAIDLQATRGWLGGVEYAQVGLIDGPGNPLAAYAAAVLALSGMMKRRRVLVCCHTGARSLAVLVMLLNLTVTCRWEQWFALLGERVEEQLPVPHDAHREAFDKMNWKALNKIVG